jgi:hypothetical protein
MKQTTIIFFIFLFSFFIWSCDNGNNNTHTHTWETAWTTNATHHWHECTAHDGAKDGEAPHQWEWKVTAPATQTAEGLETETCTTCGATNDTRPIAKLETPQGWTDETIAGIDGLKISTASGTQLTPTQMTTIKGRLKTAIEAIQGGDDAYAKYYLNEIFNTQYGLNIVLETTTEYNQYKAYGAYGRLGLNINYALNTLNATTFGTAIKAMWGDAPPSDTHTHQWEWKETTPATLTAEGLETETCTTCGATNGTRPIDKLPAPITRQYPITVAGKTVTIKDMRTGANDTDLETLGVISKLQNGLDIQTTAALGIALEHGLIIEVEETTEYTRFNAYSGNRLGARLSYVLSDDANFVLRLESTINSMMGMEPDQTEG